jgi:hypothetical protein
MEPDDLDSHFCALSEQFAGRGWLSQFNVPYRPGVIPLSPTVAEEVVISRQNGLTDEEMQSITGSPVYMEMIANRISVTGGDIGEMHRWLSEEAAKLFYVGRSTTLTTIWFQSETDMLAFKLRWAGS